MKHFSPMVEATRALSICREKIHTVNLTVSDTGPFPLRRHALIRCSETTTHRGLDAWRGRLEGFRAEATTRAACSLSAEAGMKAASRSTPTATDLSKGR